MSADLSLLGFEVQTNQTCHRWLCGPNHQIVHTWFLRTKPANPHACIARRDSSMLMCVRSPCPRPSGPPSAHNIGHAVTCSNPVLDSSSSPMWSCSSCVQCSVLGLLVLQSKPICLPFAALDPSCTDFSLDLLHRLLTTQHDTYGQPLA